jgi:hypothetical protein
LLNLLKPVFILPRLSNRTNQPKIKMKRTILKITALSLFAAAMVAAPTITRAQDATNAPAASDQTAPVKHKKHDHSVFSGKLSAIDTNAMTLTVGERTFEITSDTKITKDGQPAVLADGVVGEMAGGAYKKGADGKLDATTVSFGEKKKKKKSANPDSTGSSTNSMAN